MPMKCETHILQHPGEFSEFLRLVKSNNVSRYLEIGSKNGGSLWRITNKLKIGSRAVSVDLPYGDKSFKTTQPNLEECIRALRQRGYDAILHLGDSTDEKIVEIVRSEGPYDLCLIDANHTEPYVWKDWNNYGPMARIVAFHDINHINKNDTKKMPIDVPVVWNKIKNDYRHIEIKMDPGFNGFGILWREETK